MTSSPPDAPQSAAPTAAAPAPTPLPPPRPPGAKRPRKSLYKPAPPAPAPAPRPRRATPPAARAPKPPTPPTPHTPYIPPASRPTLAYEYLPGAVKHRSKRIAAQASLAPLTAPTSLAEAFPVPSTTPGRPKAPERPTLAALSTIAARAAAAARPKDATPRGLYSFGVYMRTLAGILPALPDEDRRFLIAAADAMVAPLTVWLHRMIGDKAGVKRRARGKAQARVTSVLRSYEALNREISVVEVRVRRGRRAAPDTPKPTVTPRERAAARAQRREEENRARAERAARREWAPAKYRAALRRALGELEDGCTLVQVDGPHGPATLTVEDAQELLATTREHH